MLPFHLEIKPGLPLYEQVILGVKRALVSGQLKPGDDFPSLRKLAEELRVNPNTAAKIVTQLKQEGVLEPMPGIGMVVARGYRARSNSREEAQLLGDELRNLVIRARHLGVTRKTFNQHLDEHWRGLNGPPSDEP